MAKLFNSLPTLNRWIELDNGYRFRLEKCDEWAPPYVLFFESNDPNEQMPVYRVHNVLEAINEICHNIGATKVLNYPFEKLPEFDILVRLNDYWAVKVERVFAQERKEAWVYLFYCCKEQDSIVSFPMHFYTDNEALEFINTFCLNNGINPEILCTE